MRLLNIKTYTLKEFLGSSSIPYYAILSHTWEEDEVLFRNIQDDTYQTRKGWTKIQNFCNEATRDGFEWVWVDTCCIDKSSSAELSEAINSMFLWYRSARVCFTYLADVGREHVDKQLPLSKWFERGWTLQELIAPVHVAFYDQAWQSLGSKHTLAYQIEYITGIDVESLLQMNAYLRRSIAQRFSWVSKRATTREEDMAYCLLGLVEINMPLLYGEGRRSFHRLQLEILKQSSDCSIFAWKGMRSADSHGLLAPWPDFFRDSNHYSNVESSNGSQTLAAELVVTNTAITLHMKILDLEYTFPGVLPALSQDVLSLHAGMLPNVNFEGRNVGIVLHRMQDGTFRRMEAIFLVHIGELVEVDNTMWLVEPSRFKIPHNSIAKEERVIFPQPAPKYAKDHIYSPGFGFVRFPADTIFPSVLYWRTEIVAREHAEIPEEDVCHWDVDGEFELPDFGSPFTGYRVSSFHHFCALRCWTICPISSRVNQFIVHFDTTRSVNMPYVSLSSTHQIDQLDDPMAFESPVPYGTGLTRLASRNEQLITLACGCKAAVEGREARGSYVRNTWRTLIRVIDLCMYAGHDGKTESVLRWEQPRRGKSRTVNKSSRRLHHALGTACTRFGTHNVCDVTASPSGELEAEPTTSNHLQTGGEDGEMYKEPPALKQNYVTVIHRTVHVDKEQSLLPESQNQLMAPQSQLRFTVDC